uniref:Uncharacterized protein n=1 Tax=Pararge aegeria TaxID=116150 RepID=S4P000_9NEOP
MHVGIVSRWGCVRYLNFINILNRNKTVYTVPVRLCDGVVLGWLRIAQSRIQMSVAAKTSAELALIPK